MRSAMKNLQWYLLGLHDSKATSEECKELLSMILDRIADEYIKQEAEIMQEHDTDDYNFYPDTDL
jgi:hypothetical protein